MSERDDLPGTVLISGAEHNRRDHYHTDETCPRLADAISTREVDPAVLTDRQECGLCAGDIDRVGARRTTYRLRCPCGYDDHVTVSTKARLLGAIGTHTRDSEDCHWTDVDVSSVADATGGEPA